MPFEPNLCSLSAYTGQQMRGQTKPLNSAGSRALTITLLPMCWEASRVQGWGHNANGLTHPIQAHSGTGPGQGPGEGVILRHAQLRPCGVKCLFSLIHCLGV